MFPDDWHKMTEITKGTILLVLVSEYYNKKITLIMNRLLYEDLNKVNLEYLQNYLKLLKNIFKQDKFILEKIYLILKIILENLTTQNFKVGVNSGLDALLLSLKSLNLKKILK